MLRNSGFLKLVKHILLFGSPVIALIFSYFVFDPFHVIQLYETYPDNFLKSYNRNRISTQIFLNNNQTAHYQAFVFGSSRSSVFYTKDWGQMTGDTLAYHFDASNEDILGIAEKIKFIDSQGNKIKNALLVFDPETFSPVVDHDKSIIHIRDWRWHKFNRFGSFANRMQYHLHFFKAFFKELYFVKFFDTLIFKKYKAYMYGSFENKHMLYTPVHNDFIFQGYIDQIKQDSIGYYNSDYFYERPTEEQICAETVNPEHEKIMEEILHIFKKNRTDYRIVFGPNYDQKKINPKDLDRVHRVFGPAKVFDYTGKNDTTEPLANYYEIYHYKPAVARKILGDLYPKTEE